MTTTKTKEIIPYRAVMQPVQGWKLSKISLSATLITRLIANSGFGFIDALVSFCCGVIPNNYRRLLITNRINLVFALFEN